MNRFWTIWKYALGSFNDEDTKPVEDQITMIRTVIVLVNFITCFFIIANIINNWS